jgi:2-keto-4-pentenoate hydratase/2-oxohepta-3-ene-1,7-dioic acid hydratase in catechol pathway
MLAAMDTLPSPSKIVCIGRNYREHAAELGNAVPAQPIFFLKPPSALVGPGDAILLPPQSEEVHYEAELALVIGRRSSWIDEHEGLAAIAAFTVLNDVTARDLQRADGRFTRAKGFDTFCPVSDARLPGDRWSVDLAGGRIQCFVDGARRQDGALADMVFGPAALVAYLSRHMTLMPGDLVATGTPAGVGALLPGQRVEVRLVGADGSALIRLENPVRRRFEEVSAATR